jgi:hypothetical protein
MEVSEEILYVTVVENKAHYALRTYNLTPFGRRGSSLEFENG